ncbi:rhoptry neck protein 2, putative [Eimeria maxima]|uniref:Rhoptry neck protein 2, putative n=1 Tax=Eimeria maxima TaxID=5804 RepID=U6M2J1_EIMMA|nr:rhoptry neck protein 2, putative [Eimeria maxima]CDJ57288.1 rhoptry neck protein 2, putative [Eimeria maxima]
MGVFTLLLAGGAFLCSSSSPSFFATAASASAAAGPESKTYNLPSGGSLHIQVSRDVLPPTATTATSSSFSYGTPLSIPGATGSYGQYILTDNVEYRSGEVPILQQATGAAAAAATGGPSFLPSTFISSGAPLPTSQIIYGWVPDPDAATSSLASLNAAELNNALRSPAFVNKLRTRAMVEKSCNIPLAVDDRSYLESFYLSLIAERRFREREEEEKKEIEEELHQQQIAAANMNYARSAAARANIEKGKTGTGRGGEITGAEEEEEEEETAAALRYQETVDRIMSSRLEVLLTCKLAALLAQPNLFLNKNIQSIKLLELIAAALGVADNNSTDVLATANAAAAAATAATAGRSAPGGAAPSGVSATPMFGGIEPFLVASNPITTGHLLTLMIGYLERNSFFGPDARKPFYNFSTLIGGGGGEGGITMLDEMCSIDRDKDDMEQEMLSYSIPVEPLVDAATNAARIQIKTCRGGAANCLFNNSILNPLLNPLDVNNIIQNTKTREAFNFYTGLASAQIGNLLEDAGPRYYDIRAEQWVDALAKPAANTDSKYTLQQQQQQQQ